MTDYDDLEEALTDIAEERVPPAIEGLSDEIRFWQQDIALSARPLARQLIAELDDYKLAAAAEAELADEFRERALRAEKENEKLKYTLNNHACWPGY